MCSTSVFSAVIFLDLSRLLLSYIFVAFPGFVTPNVSRPPRERRSVRVLENQNGVLSLTDTPNPIPARTVAQLHQSSRSAAFSPVSIPLN